MRGWSIKAQHTPFLSVTGRVNVHVHQTEIGPIQMAIIRHGRARTSMLHGNVNGRNISAQNFWVKNVKVANYPPFSDYEKFFILGLAHDRNFKFSVKSK